jgi:LPXTG-motif cell wall-anchored protein
LVDRSVVTAGEVVTVSGAGFLPGEQVEVWLQPTGGRQATAIADGSGLVTHALVIPPATSPCEYTIELRGISSGLTMSSPTIAVLAGVPVSTTAVPRSSAPALPATGNEERNLALAGGALILIGAAFVLVERRSRREAVESNPSRP